MAHPVDEYVGRRLRERRTLMGMSQESLANSVGVTFQQIQKYERGTNRMSASRLYEFAKILGTDVGYFFEGYETKQPYAGTGVAEEEASFEYEDISSREVLELMKAYRRITEPKAKKAINDLIRAVADDVPTVAD